MKIIAFLSIAVVPFIANAQIDPIVQMNRNVIENWSGTYKRVGQYKVKGTEMLMGQPMKGVLYCKGEAPVPVDKILYDLSLNEVGPEIGGKVMVPDAAIDSFAITFPEAYGGNEVWFKNPSLYNSKEKQFFNELAVGSRACLLKVYKVKTVADPSNLMDKDIKIFEQYVEYFIYLPKTKKMEKVKLQKKALFSALEGVPGVENAATQLDLTKEKDVIKLVKVLNS